MKHTKYVCGCGRSDCHFCAHGLQMCAACCETAATSTTDCPGRLLTATEMREVEARQLDFRDGEWVRGPRV